MFLFIIVYESQVKFHIDKKSSNPKGVNGCCFPGGYSYHFLISILFTLKQQPGYKIVTNIKKKNYNSNLQLTPIIKRGITLIT